jgi:hypothetical protein
MALLTAQTPTSAAGLVPSLGAANASDTFSTFGPGVFLMCENSNAATRTITLTTPGTYRGLAVADPGPTIGATTGRLVLGPLLQDLYMDPATGVGTVTPSATAGVTYALVNLQVP